MTDPLVPRPYQQEGIDAFLEHHKYANHDKPGLGKSLQAALAASQHLPAVISSPVYLTLQWFDFLSNQFDGATIYLCDDTDWAKRQLKLLSSADFYIINHDMFRTYIMPPKMQTIVLDEAHHFRGRNAKRSKNAQLWAMKTPNVYQLTATPIHRTADDLYMQLRILDPRNFSSYYRFIDDYCLVSHRGFTPIVRGTRRPKALNALLDNYRIGRDYTDVGMAVPSVVYHDLLVEPTPGLLKRYKQIKQNYRDDTTGILYGSAIEKLTALRRLTVCREKIDAVKSLIDDVVTTDSGYLVYCNYIDTAEQFARELKATLITGNTPSSQRLSLAKSSKKVVATVKAMAEGGDLTHLKTIIYVEEDYLPGTATQTIGRVKRPTTNIQPINCYYVMLNHTIDITIHKCVRGRVHDAESVMQQELL